ncbi:MAG: PE-PPE domain-containing protein, partial [Mycobacterium sp.]
IQDFIGDFTGTGPNPVTLSLTTLLDPSSSVAGDPATSLTDVVNALSSAASAAYSALLPTADLINAALTSIPAYDAGLFADNLQAGDLLDAVGLPIAADTGLVSMGALLEAVVVLGAVTTVVSDLASIIP